MDWKARIDEVREEGQGNMFVGATLGDADDPNTTYPWTHTYSREWLEAHTNGQVRDDITADLTATAQSLASAGARIDQFKAYIGTVIDLDVVL
jgi:hypothetical protein